MTCRTCVTDHAAKYSGARRAEVSMTVFTIDKENHVVAYASLEAAAKVKLGRVGVFSSEDELNALAREWPGTRLVALWNALPGVLRVRKFTDRKTAVRRIFQAIQRLEPVNEPATTSPARKDSKKARVLELLRRPEGTTVKEIMSVTDWQSHTVRGFLSGTVGKRMGLAVSSQRRESGERAYRVVDPMPGGQAE